MSETSWAAWQAPAALVVSGEHLPAHVLQEWSRKAHATIANKNYSLQGAVLYSIFLSSKTHQHGEQDVNRHSRLRPSPKQD